MCFFNCGIVKILKFCYCLVGNIHLIECTANDIVLVDRLEVVPRLDDVVVAEVGQVGEQEAQRVAELAIGIGNLLEDVVGNRDVLRIVDRCNPEP